MPRSIPTNSAPADEDKNEDEDENEEGMNAYFDIIEVKLTEYENLLNEVHVLFSDQFGFDEGIVLDILSFL